MISMPQSDLLTTSQVAESVWLVPTRAVGLTDIREDGDTPHPSRLFLLQRRLRFATRMPCWGVDIFLVHWS